MINETLARFLYAKNLMVVLAILEVIQMFLALSK